MKQLRVRATALKIQINVRRQNLIDAVIIREAETHIGQDNMKMYSDRRSFGGRNGAGKGAPQKSWGNSRGRDDRVQMHSATCSECEARCEVPFKPNGRKPVLCTNCFRDRDSASSSKRNYGDDRETSRSFRETPSRDNARGEGNFEVVKQLKALNDKMEKLLELMSEFEQGDFEDEDEDMEPEENMSQKPEDKE